MKFLGLEITRKKGLTPVSGGGFWNVIRESFAGAWQRNVEIESQKNLLAFSAVYACVSLIANDIGKLRLRLMELEDSGIWSEVTRESPFLAVLRKPNRYQTRIQFLVYWLASKLLHGNAYILKERDGRGIVVALYCLDPRQVKPMIADDGSVFYQLKKDALTGVDEDIAIPASEIIHDRCIALFHPLVGISPIYACGASATQGIRIQNNSAIFFENMSRPSGQLTAPGEIKEATAERLKKDFEANFSGGKLGRLLVAGDGLKYEAMTIPAVDAQLIEQLRWTVEDVARTFGVPLYKIASGANPTFSNVGAMNQDYYIQTLQSHIESLELLLDEGLEVVDAAGRTYGIELDLDGLLRMDPLSRADRNEKAIRAGYLTPNEARRSENLAPIEGGDSAFLQQQNYSLAALAKRDAREDPFAPAKPPAPPAPPPPVDGADPAADPPEPPAAAAKALELVEQAVAPIVLRVNALETAVASIPEPEPGPPGEPGEPGKDADPEAVRDLVATEVRAAVGMIPIPKDGEPGPPGKDADPVKIETIVALVSGEVAKAVAEIPKPKDGEPGRDAAEIEILEEIDPARSYARGTFAKYRNGLVRAARATDPLEGGTAFRDSGWTVVTEGIYLVEVQQGENLRSFAIGVESTSGEIFAKTFDLPVVIDRGIYRNGEKYSKGDSVSWDGSIWIALADVDKAGDRPGQPEWRLAVKRGRDGKDAAPPPAPAAPLSLR